MLWGLGEEFGSSFCAAPCRCYLSLELPLRRSRNYTAGEHLRLLCLSHIHQHQIIVTNSQRAAVNYGF